MSARLERLEFAPPPTPGLLRSVALAILAHGLLVGVLTAGVAWKRTPQIATVTAELWSALPQQAAAPAPEEMPVEETLPPKSAPEPPAPTARPEPAKPPPPDTSKADADIALAKKKAQQEKEESLRLEKLAKEKLAREKLEKDKAEKDKLEKEKLEKEKRAKEKLAREKAEKDKQNQDKLAREKAAKANEAKDAKAMEEQRQANLKRMAGLAGSGGSGSANATGNAMQDSGPSAGYAGRIVGRIKPNIVFTESISGNPRVEVEIRTASSGAILSARVTQSSGVKSWDDAVLRAIEKTEILPKDLDGRVPTSMQIGFRPKD